MELATRPPAAAEPDLAALEAEAEQESPSTTSFTGEESEEVPPVAAGPEAGPEVPTASTLAYGDPGKPLPEHVRARMEVAFGADFSAVRIHESPSVTALGARAYARGTDLYFAPGLYDPESPAGQELLGHELAHVVQQARGEVGANGNVGGMAVNGEPSLERDADDAGKRAASQAPVAERSAGAAPAITPAPSAGAPAQLDAENEEVLRLIQGHPMAVLLQKLAQVPPEVLADERAAHVGGPRLRLAMRAVRARQANIPWATYAASNTDVESLPQDQVIDIMRYLGASASEIRFRRMWDAHPHNYQDDESENIDSPTLLDEHGLPQSFANTCAIRISIMLNEIGEKITPAKTAAAGLARKPHYSKKTKQYYILGAAEMWQYFTKVERKPDVTLPANGRYRDEAEFQDAFEGTIQPALAGRQGFVAFDRIFGYGGTGHVDIFRGEQLSNAAGWYPCQRLLLWYF